MRNQDQQQIGHTIARIMLISPEQNELLRRNRSRIFIWPENESVIDSILFQGYRPVEDFMDAASRAIEMAGLRDNSGASSDQLKAVHNPQFAGGMLQHFLTTNGWLQNENGEVYDMALAIEIDGERLPQPDITTYNAAGGDADENPLVLVIDTEQLFFSGEDYEDQDQGGDIVQLQADNQEQEQNERPDGQQADRERMSARQGQDRDDQGGEQSGGNNSQRMAGKPGRVRDPSTDMRLKANRSRMARRPQNDDDGPSGGSGGGTASRSRAGGRGTQSSSRGGRGGGTRASASASFGNWPDGTPRTVSPVKADGTPRKKPGPQFGATYRTSVRAAG